MEAREPEPELFVAEMEAQTEQEKGNLAGHEVSRLREQDKGGIPSLLTIAEDDSKWKKKKVNVRRGTRGIE